MTVASAGFGCRPPVRISAMRPSSTTTVAFSFGCGVRQSMTFALMRTVLMSFQSSFRFHSNRLAELARAHAAGLDDDGKERRDHAVTLPEHENGVPCWPPRAAP